MGWPKGVPRKVQDPTVAEIPTTKTLDEVLSTVSCSTRKRVSLKNRAEDPFTKFKDDEKRFAYRALNINKRNMREKEAEGWQPIPGSEYGDLILAKLTRDDYEDNKQSVIEKTQAQTQATVEQFKEEANKFGVQVDDDTQLGG